MDKKKVLFVATLVKNHMMEFHIPYLKMFQEMGWETSVAAKNDFEDPKDCIIPYCDNYFDIPFERNPLNVKNIKAYLELKKVIAKGNYDLIHCHTPVGAALTRIAAIKARKSGTKVIYTAHGFHFYKGAPLLNWLLYFPTEYILANLTDVLITINKEDYGFAKKHLAAKNVEYIPGVGIDISKFGMDENVRKNLRQKLNIPDDAFVLLSVGDLNKNKNHISVINALENINDDSIYYVVCGRGPLLDKYNQIIKQKNLSDRVFFMGYRNDVKDFYKMADVFIFPSFREGLSVSIMEAMASGLPIICSNIRGNTDLVEDGINGYYIEPNNTMSIIKAIINIKNNDFPIPSDLNYGLARKYSIEIILEKYRNIYLNI